MCPAGKYQNTRGMTECIECEVGTFARTPGAWHCRACALVGGFVPVEGQTNCTTMCVEGEYASSFKRGDGFTCRECSPHTATSSADVSSACSIHQDARHWPHPLSTSAAGVLHARFVMPVSLHVNQLETRDTRATEVAGFESVLMPATAMAIANVDYAMPREAQCVSRDASGVCPGITECPGTRSEPGKARALCYLLEAHGSESQRVRSDATADVVRHVVRHGVDGGGWVRHGALGSYEFVGDFALRVRVPAGETRSVTVDMAPR